ncbi:uncharacterized protein LOC34618391 [Cyclospora cayetanensis]|uniref:Uncharacterized protein LOC34618391 n=1 Tax=Cyclospora cayetanensis TaxID=88456 RepID=A0A6P6RTU0_9EIME|nr:uncharacterized protein LOC34618391 [Cyclospora cayetanensis]
MNSASEPSLLLPPGASRGPPEERAYRPTGLVPSPGNAPQHQGVYPPHHFQGAWGPSAGSPYSPYWPYGSEQATWASTPSGAPTGAPGALGASQVALESEVALIHFVVYLVCCIGCVCIYLNYVVLEAHIFALFWAVVFSIPLRAVVSAIVGQPVQRSAPSVSSVSPSPAAAPPPLAAAAERTIRDQQGPLGRNGGAPSAAGEVAAGGPHAALGGTPKDGGPPTAAHKRAIRLKSSREAASRHSQQQQGDADSPPNKGGTQAATATLYLGVTDAATPRAAHAAAATANAARASMQRGSSAPMRAPGEGHLHRSSKKRRQQDDGDPSGDGAPHEASFPAYPIPSCPFGNSTSRSARLLRELTTLWETAHSLLEVYVVRSASFQEAYAKLSALLQHQPDGAAAAAAAAVEGVTAASETPNTLAGFVAAAASAVRSTAAPSGSSSGSSTATLLLGGSLGWYSDLWRAIQELASASSAVNAAASAAAGADSASLAALQWTSTTASSSLHTEASRARIGSTEDPPRLATPSAEWPLAAPEPQQQPQQQKSRFTHLHTPPDPLFFSHAETCPRFLASEPHEVDVDLEGHASAACFLSSGGLPEGLSSCQGEIAGWDATKAEDLTNPSLEVSLLRLHDGVSLSCIDPWRLSGGDAGSARRVFPLGFAWPSTSTSCRREGLQGSSWAASFLSLLLPAGLWKRWPNTAELLGHLREGNFLLALKRSLEASQEVYSLTREAWWKYLSEHAHTLLAWAFNSGQANSYSFCTSLQLSPTAIPLKTGSLDLVDEVLCVVDPSAILSTSVNEKIRAILFSSVKKVWFYSLFTWLIFESTGMPVVYVPTAVSSLLALLPILPPEVVSLLPSIALWLHKDVRDFGGLSTGDAQTAEAWGPWLAAPHRLAALGRSGPALATMPLIVVSAASKFNERHIRTQEALTRPLSEGKTGVPFFHAQLDCPATSRRVDGVLQEKLHSTENLGLANNGALSNAAWGPPWGPLPAGGFALGEWRSGRKSNTNFSVAPLRGSFHEEIPSFQAPQFPLQSPARTIAATQESVPQGSLPPPFRDTQASSALFGLSQGVTGTPPQQALAVHFIKSAADAIRWVLQRRRSGVGASPVLPSVALPGQYPWAPGAPIFGGPVQQVLHQSHSAKPVGSNSPRKAMSMGEALRTPTDEELSPSVPAASSPAAAQLRAYSGFPAATVGDSVGTCAAGRRGPSLYRGRRRAHSGP